MKNNLLAILFIAVIASSQNQSFAQNMFDDDGFVYVQIQVRNKDGMLVSYMESDRVLIVDQKILDELLDKGGESIIKSIQRVNERNFEIIKGYGVLNHDSDMVVSKTAIHTLQDPPSILAIADHDGYPVTKGDQVISVWTIIRPVD
jgi:hypothetical protein